MTIATIHGYEVRAFVQTETHNDGRVAGIVLVLRRDDTLHPWVTAWWRVGERSWDSGHYFRTLSEAWPDFMERIARSMPRIES